MRLHSQFLSVEKLLSGTAEYTPRSLGLTMPGEWEQLFPANQPSQSSQSLQPSKPPQPPQLSQSSYSQPHPPQLLQAKQSQPSRVIRYHTALIAELGTRTAVSQLLSQPPHQTAPASSISERKRAEISHSTQKLTEAMDEETFKLLCILKELGEPLHLLYQNRQTPTQIRKWLNESPSEPLVPESTNSPNSPNNTNSPNNKGNENPVQDSLSHSQSTHAPQDQKVYFHKIPYNDVWLRDTGPIFLRPNGYCHPESQLRAEKLLQKLQDRSPQGAKSGLKSGLKNGLKSELAGRLIGGAVIFKFNGWGEKYPYHHDQALAEAWVHDLANQGCLAAYDDFFLFQTDFICEGGALECNGAGLALTTRSVLLNPNRRLNDAPTRNSTPNSTRNFPHSATQHSATQHSRSHSDSLSQAEIELVLKELLGLEKVIFLPSGLIDDDTDGHIDNICRFVNADTILLADKPIDPLSNRPIDPPIKDIKDFSRAQNSAYAEDAPASINLASHSVNLTTSFATSSHSQVRSEAIKKKEQKQAQTLAISRQILHDLKSELPLNIKSLPLPPPIYREWEEPLREPMCVAQSYLNYLPLKTCILVPSYHKAYEYQWIEPVLKAAFPKQVIRWIDWRHHIWEGGGIHCRTLSLPLAYP